jgi:uncharacterized phage protein (TIGR01671 family)
MRDKKGGLMTPKCRAWDKRCKMMSVSGYFDYTEGRTTLYFSLEGVLFVNSKGSTIDMLHTEAKARYVVMQSTGLKDKNGAGIFDGDIVRSYLGTIHEIKYSKGQWRAILKNRNGITEWPAQYLYCEYMGWEIIGNIHANPELLEADQCQ